MVAVIPMKLIVPDYYPQFRCKADACRHSCCIGWEIDIDETALARFRAVEGELGQRLQEQIDTEGTPHFRLGSDERCPFLNEQGLCDLIIRLGEDSLCQICADHPRFRNEFSHCTEMGLGLTCEAAAELILRQSEPMTLIALQDDGGGECPDEEEQYLLAVRDNALAIARDRDFTVTERMENLCDLFAVPLPEYSPAQWAEVFLALERLDDHWTALLHKLKQPIPSCDLTHLETAFEQLLVYFLYRHLPAALRDGDVDSKIGFAVLSTQMLMWLYAATHEALPELARMYSSEVEYSDENLEILFDLLWETESGLVP